MQRQYFLVRIGDATRSGEKCGLELDVAIPGLG